MKLTQKQIHDGIKSAEEYKEACSHRVIFYNYEIDDYPSGSVETWACLVCGKHDRNSTGGNGNCCGPFGSYKLGNPAVVIKVDRSTKNYPSSYRTFDSLFKELKKAIKKGAERNISYITFRYGRRIEDFNINQETTDQEMENIIGKLRKILET